MTMPEPACRGCVHATKLTPYRPRLGGDDDIAYIVECTMRTVTYGAPLECVCYEPKEAKP